MMQFRNRHMIPPDTFAIRLFRKSFEDFYNWGKEVANDEYLQHYLGYEREDITEREILAIAKDFNKELSILRGA